MSFLQRTDFMQSCIIHSLKNRAIPTHMSKISCVAAALNVLWTFVQRGPERSVDKARVSCGIANVFWGWFRISQKNSFSTKFDKMCYHKRIQFVLT